MPSFDELNDFLDFCFNRIQMLLLLSFRNAPKVRRTQEKISVLQKDKYGLLTETNTSGRTMLPSLSQVNSPETKSKNIMDQLASLCMFFFFLSCTPWKIVPEQKNAGFCVTAQKFTWEIGNRKITDYWSGIIWVQMWRF